MKNITMKLEGTILTIIVDMARDFGKSATGKSVIIASTEGNQTIPGTDGKIGVNVYRKAGGVEATAAF